MRFFWIILLSLSLAGCASSVVYNPMQVANQQELLLNESGFKAVREGMTIDQVHTIMGTALVIGYSFQSPDYKPLTIPNPYKSEAIRDTGYFIEYYIEAIRQPDGIVSDNELMPLIFQNGKLIGRGWDLVHSLRPAKPPA
ncbi:MAG: hypothetical protein HQL12_05060 [Candidatus Omnitrophica bacterium]|nr:hypothetical protein [Candidatus Omnitrophota bacterium]